MVARLAVARIAVARLAVARLAVARLAVARMAVASFAVRLPILQVIIRACFTVNLLLVSFQNYSFLQEGGQTHKLSNFRV